MFIGRYDFAGDPGELLAAYDRLMGTMPAEDLLFHACVRTGDGIAVLDACPSEEVFAAFSTDPQVLGAFAASGLPAPAVTPIGEVHTTRVKPDAVVLTG